MPSFSIPLSGLNASSTALSAISNDIANLNTVGYKGTTPEFADLFYQQIGTAGSGDPVQLGAGARVATVASVFTQGSIESTGVNTDMAIQGDGFFVTRDASGLLTYTRAGNFSVDSNGILTAADGSKVLGYPAVNGVIDTNQPLAPVAVAGGQVSPASATTQTQLNMNLDASAAVGSSFSTPVTVYDSLGTAHVLTYNFTKTGTNAWNYNITIPGADVGQATDQSISSGTLGFDGTGALNAVTVTAGGTAAAPASGVTGIPVTGLADGANTLTFDWNFTNNGNPLVTQVAGPSATSATHQDGFSSGSLLNFSLTKDGTIQGIFSNGRTAAIGQLALATFPNTQGLLRNGSNDFLSTLASGSPSTGVAGTGGRGTISGGALELSNVDVASEFSKLIVAQRGFQANAKTITTFDEVTQDAINLKR
jgi:flagellar hook protein FlgE